jgi:hypothetical protein
MAAKRVAGVQSDIDDLILRSSGRPLTMELGTRITEDPTLIRTIEGASSISLDVFDPEMQVLRKSLLAEQWDCEVDGLGFRYTGLAKAENTLTLTLEDEWVAMLKEKKGPIRVKRANSTRAEFIKRLVEEACPGLDFYCPQLHVKQPIGTNTEKHADRKKTREEAKELQEESEENRGPGIGANTAHLRVKGQKPSPAQSELGELGLHIANSVSAPYVVQVALIAALIDENDMSSPNCLQAEQELTGEGGAGAAVQPAADEISGFLTGKPEWTGTTAIDYHKNNPSAPFYEIAQAVQGSAFEDGSNYAAFGEEAREWVSVFWGESGGISSSSSKTVVEPYRFEVKGGEKGKRNGAPENYWEAIRRLAKEVNWRAFIVGDRMYFMPETELIESMVRLALDRDTPNIENVDFEYHVGGEVTEVTVTALIGEWKAPPGSVVTLAGYGPASLATPENRKADAAKGPGRYLVASIETPMSDQPAKRMATITLKTPTRPLAEPQAKTKSVSVNGKGKPTGTGTGSKSTLQLAKDAFTVKGTTDWNGIMIAKWIYPALLWAKENGGNTEVTSGFRPGPDPNTASGVSEHQGDSYQGSPGPVGGIVKGAIDFGDEVDPVGEEHRESFLRSLNAGYPGPMLYKLPGDAGHCSATGH